MRATKLITCIKHLTYAERLSYLNLPTLHYRRVRGDMIIAFKIVTGVMDSMGSYKFIGSHSVTRGNRHKLTQKHVHYNLTKFSFSNKVVSIWNSLPDIVVSACSVNIFENHLDYFWRDQVCLCAWKASLSGIRSRSFV